MPSSFIRRSPSIHCSGTEKLPPPSRYFAANPQPRKIVTRAEWSFCSHAQARRNKISPRWAKAIWNSSRALRASHPLQTLWLSLSFGRIDRVGVLDTCPSVARFGLLFGCRAFDVLVWRVIKEAG